MSWSIFPLEPRGKKPITTNGLKAATTNPETIRRWWEKTPDANIGLNCGASGIVVIDLDRREAHDGLAERNGPAEWEELLRRQRLTVNTSVSKTGGGGRHLLFKAPVGVKIANSAGKLAPGIDVRGEGGYVVLPPSIHPSGQTYAWCEGATTIAQLPLPIVDILIHEPDPWQIFTLHDAFTPREPLTWIVSGIISAGSLTILYGPPGTLKSMLMSDLAVSVASGSRWLAKANEPDTGIPTVPSPVMWLDFDNGRRRTHERFAALARARKLNNATPIYYVSMPDPTLIAGDTESIRALAARVLDRNIGLVVIDNLGVIAGDADENSAEMQQPMAGLRWLAETGTAVVVLHHQRKSNGLTNVRAGEGLRGHGSIEAKLDLAMQVARDGPVVTVTPTKTRGPDVKEFAATFAFENDENNELLTARFYPVDVDAEKQQDQDNLKQTVLDEVRKAGSTSASKLFNDIGGNRNQLFDALRQLKMAGQLIEKKNPRGGYLLYLP